MKQSDRVLHGPHRIGEPQPNQRTRLDQTVVVAGPASASSDEICVSFMQRQRACSEALALVQEAFEEWRHDSRDGAIGALCDDIARSLSPAKDAELRTRLSACLATAGCELFVGCAVPLDLIRWKE